VCAETQSSSETERHGWCRNRETIETDRQGMSEHLVQCVWTECDWKWPYLELCGRKWEGHSPWSFECACKRGRGLRKGVCICVSVAMRERASKISGACMNYAGCSLECRVLADRVPFSLICLWFIFHSNFAMCSFKHTENRKPRAVELACSCQISIRRSDTKWEKLMNVLIVHCFKITSQTAARLYSQHYCFSLTAVS